MAALGSKISVDEKMLWRTAAVQLVCMHYNERRTRREGYPKSTGGRFRRWEKAEGGWESVLGDH